MKQQKLNKIFQVVQTLQVTLLILQGILLITDGSNQFSLPIWVLLGVLSLGQLAIAFLYPQRVEPNSLSVERSAIVKLRLLAVVPYILIVIGLLLSK